MGNANCKSGSPLIYHIPNTVTDCTNINIPASFLDNGNSAGSLSVINGSGLTFSNDPDIITNDPRYNGMWNPVLETYWMGLRSTETFGSDECWKDVRLVDSAGVCMPSSDCRSGNPIVYTVPPSVTDCSSIDLPISVLDGGNSRGSTVTLINGSGLSLGTHSVSLQTSYFDESDVCTRDVLIQDTNGNCPGQANCKNQFPIIYHIPNTVTDCTNINIPPSVLDDGTSIGSLSVTNGSGLTFSNDPDIITNDPRYNGMWNPVLETYWMGLVASENYGPGGPGECWRDIRLVDSAGVCRPSSDCRSGNPIVYTIPPSETDCSSIDLPISVLDGGNSRGSVTLINGSGLSLGTHSVSLQTSYLDESDMCTRDVLIQDTNGVCPSTEVTGDPHFTTWSNEHFEFHGQCDLVLMSDPKFAEGKGLDIQIRTKLVRYWSFIKTAAIRIGNDIIEIQGSDDSDANTASYWVNYEYQAELSEIGGFPVSTSSSSPKKREYLIDLDAKYPGQSILIKTFKEFVAVKVVNGSEDAFGNTVGMSGEYQTGQTLARDHETILHDFADLGMEWQVLPSDPKLFHQMEPPQFPELCLMPENPRGERRRRLAESNISIEEAESACSGLKDEATVKDCVYDILATQDLDMVGAF